MPTHLDMPQRWQEHARKRSSEVTLAVEAAREQRAASAPASHDQLARRRMQRLAAQEAERAFMSVPPPPSAA